MTAVEDVERALLTVFPEEAMFFWNPDGTSTADQNVALQAQAGRRRAGSAKGTEVAAALL